ncbi:hypothetical protein ACJX0J_011447, partial [Zea mays]
SKITHAQTNNEKFSPILESIAFNKVFPLKKHFRFEHLFFAAVKLCSSTSSIYFFSFSREKKKMYGTTTCINCWVLENHGLVHHYQGGGGGG